MMTRQRADIIAEMRGDAELFLDMQQILVEIFSREEIAEL